MAQAGEEFIFTGDLSRTGRGQDRAGQWWRAAASQPSNPALAKAEAILAPETLNAADSWHLGHSVLFGSQRPTGASDDQEAVWLESLRDKGGDREDFAWRFFTSGDSREPELAGIRGAIVGSLLTVIVTLALSVPLGIAAAVYLEEFAPKNRWTELIEVNINNLAAVPSIIFGLLGLAVFLNFFGLPRSAPLVGGLVLALLVCRPSSSPRAPR